MSILSLKDFLIKKAISFIGGQKYLTVQFDITNACNLSCLHCYHKDHLNKGALKFEDWIQVLNQYESLINKLYLNPSIIICGGEPLTSPMLFPLIDEIKKRWADPKLFILTNGTRVTKEFVNKIKDLNISIQVSLDGPNATAHDKIRGVGNFQKAINSIQLLREAKVSTVLLSILSLNTSTQVEDYFKLAKGLNVNAMNFTRLIPSGFGANYVSSGKDTTLLGLDLKKALESIIFYSNSYGVPTNTDQPLYSLVDPKLGASGKFGFQGLVIDYKGNLKVSSRVNFVLGHVLKEGLENLFFQHPILKQLRDKNSSECGSCEHYLRCGGNRNLSFIKDQSFLTKDPGCWISTQQYLMGESI